jgi:MinD-like ATPase involved in chromosome partitioning or flagellar assembly
VNEVAGGLLVALGASQHEPAVLTAVEQTQLHVVRRCVDIADLMATAASRQAEVALISADLPGLDAEVVERVQSEGVAVVGVLPTSSSADEAVLRAQGVAHIASSDDMVSLVELVTTIAADREQQQYPADSDEMTHHGVDVADPARRGVVVAVWGPTGAPGRSTISMGVAAALAELRLPTMLIDADVYGGSTAVQLGVLDEMSGLLAAARAANAGVLRPEALAGHARTVAADLRVLTGLPRADRWTEVKAVLMGRIVQTARQLAEYVVVDCGFSLERDEEVMYDTAAPRRNGATVEILERADVILLVGSADPVGLSRLVRAAHELASVVPEARPWVVVNRVRPTLGWSTEEMTATLTQAVGRTRLVYLPEDQAAVDRSLVHGTTLIDTAPDARLTRAVRELVGELSGRTMDARRTPVRSRTPGKRRREPAFRRRTAARDQ